MNPPSSPQYTSSSAPSFSGFSVPEFKKPAASSNNEQKWDRVFCQNHPNAHVIEDYRVGDMICSSCGLVIGDRAIDSGAEWREFSSDPSDTGRSRVGESENPMLETRGMSTFVERSPNFATDEHGRALYKSSKQLTPSDRALVKASKEIRALAEKINVTKGVVERAVSIYKEHCTPVGRVRESNTAACLHIACGLEDCPRTFREISTISGFSLRDLGRSIKRIKAQLQSKPENVSVGAEFVARFCSNLGLPFQMERIVNHILEKTQEFNLCSGRSPITVTSTVIFLAVQVLVANRPDPSMIAKTTGVAESTLISLYNLLRPQAEKLFPEDFKYKIPLADLPYF